MGKERQIKPIKIESLIHSFFCNGPKIPGLDKEKFLEGRNSILYKELEEIVETYNNNISKKQRD